MKAKETGLKRKRLRNINQSATDNLLSRTGGNKKGGDLRPWRGWFSYELRGHPHELRGHPHEWGGGVLTSCGGILTSCGGVLASWWGVLTSWWGILTSCEGIALANIFNLASCFCRWLRPGAQIRRLVWQEKKILFRDGTTIFSTSRANWWIWSWQIRWPGASRIIYIPCLGPRKVKDETAK